MVCSVKVIELNLKKGYAEIIVETEDDLWALYNIIEKDDVVTAKTTREVKHGDSDAGRRIPMVISVRVEDLEFQPFTDRLRVKGVVVDAPEEYGIKGKHHTLAIYPGIKLVLWKSSWQERHLKLLEKFSGVKSRVLVAVLDYDEACIALVSEQGIKVVSELRSSIPGKYFAVDSSPYITGYVKEVAESIASVAAQYNIDVVVVASPGDLAKYVVDMLKGRVERVFRDSVSIGGCSGLNELLRRDSVRRAVEELSILRAQEILDEFKLLLVKNPELVAYGLDDVEYAVDLNAVKKMVVSSDMIHSYDEKLRSRISNLIEKAYEKKAEVVIVPHHTDVGREVSGLGGVIAVLRFQLQRVAVQ